MTALFASHPWIAFATAVLLGMTVEWVLEFLFVRRRMFDLERQLNERERDHAELRHSHGRTLNDLRNKLTELDAVQKSRVLAETSLSARDREIAAVRAELAEEGRQRAEAEAGRIRAVDERDGARAEAAGLRQAVAEAEAGRSGAEAAVRDLEFRVAELDAQRATEAGAAEVHRKVAAERAAEVAAARSEAARLRAEMDAQGSVLGTVEEALRQRDASLSDVRSRLAEVDGERVSVASALARADEECARLRRTVGELEQQLAEVPSAPEPPETVATNPTPAVDPVSESRLHELETALEEARKAAGDLEARLRRQEADFQAALAASESAATLGRTLEAERAEKSALSQQISRLQANISNATRARGEADDRIRALEAEVAALRTARETPPPPEEDPSGPRIAELEAELAAVSESHARLEAELSAARSGDSTGTRAVRPEGGLDPDLDAVLADLDAVVRERNELAAELASLRAAAAPGRAGRRGGEEA